jgi:hypothetical protein
LQVMQTVIVEDDEREGGEHESEGAGRQEDSSGADTRR